uniref:Uncharacterized protein n=1 Tax=Oryzias latipes TaxID=8090 RepID=A0A3B3I1U2_ORYLA
MHTNTLSNTHTRTHILQGRWDLGPSVPYPFPGGGCGPLGDGGRVPWVPAPWARRCSLRTVGGVHITPEPGVFVSLGGGSWSLPLGAGPRQTSNMAEPGRKPESSAQTSKWWSSYLPSFSFWPRNTETDGLKKGRKKRAAAQQETDGDFSDYETPPPSPLPISLSPFRLFAHSLTVEILAEHYEICFNFLRHLFDLCVVAFLWTVSPPAKLVLEVLGVQGALKLWLHGMALFFVSTVGMAGLLWLIQEYLPQFALIYGIIQALVISVSIRQSVILEIDEDKKEEEERDEEIEGQN